jgi:TPR repeat protein
MPEVPSNMQEQLSHLELEAKNPPAHRMSSASTVSGMSGMQSPPLLDQHRAQNIYSSLNDNNGPGFTASYEHTNASAYQNIDRENKQTGGVRPHPQSPNFSPFPKPRDPGPNVPLSDEDKEEVLERARPLVLKSIDPEMQLAWAQDALSWVEVASTFASRLQSEGQPPRTMTPKVEHSLRVDALNIVKFLAEQTHPKAEFMQAMWLEFGKFGNRVDKREAFMGYRRSAEKGYARSEYRMGMIFESSNDSVNALEHYNRGVGMGDSAAHYRLGMMTLLGQHGMHQDYGRGVDLIKYSADMADENAPQGAYVYGMLLARELPNISVPEQFLPFDLNEAKLYIEKAAYLGFSKAQLKMAQAYELCQLGCEFEPSLSLHYNALAARQGEAEADMAISKWFLCGFENVFEKNEELAFTYAKRAAITKMPTAEFAMGYFYEIGMYVQVDLEESAAWYAKAADHGNKDALGRIDSIRKNSTLSKTDHEQVAINRIKSTHGSQRGGRPDRFKQRGAPLPVIQDDGVDMPDPRNKYDPVSGQVRQPGNLHARPKSVAPYPEDDMVHAASFSNGPNGPFNGQGLRPHSQMMAPLADRASSPFGIKPPQHSNTMGLPQAGGRPDERLRPSSSMGNMQHVPAGRGHDPQGRGGVVSQAPGNYRQSSAGFLPPVDVGPPVNFGQAAGRTPKPAPLNTSKPQPPQPAGYPQDLRQASLPQGYGGRPDSVASGRGPTQSAMSQGYGGRPDSAAAGRGTSQAARQPRGSSAAMTSSVSSPQLQGPTHSMQSPQAHPQAGYPQPSQTPTQGRPQQRPPQQTMSSQAPSQPSQRASSHTPAHSGSFGPDSRASSVAPSIATNNSSAPPATPSSAAVPTRKPAKSGPATFEDMGIPQAKQESECVSCTNYLTKFMLTCGSGRHVNCCY